MNEDVFVAQLGKLLDDIEGVINVLGIVAYNKVGGEYSINPISWLPRIGKPIIPVNENFH